VEFERLVIKYNFIYIYFFEMVGFWFSYPFGCVYSSLKKRSMMKNLIVRELVLENCIIWVHVI
jgi:hypothetical protein